MPVQVAPRSGTITPFSFLPISPFIGGGSDHGSEDRTLCGVSLAPSELTGRIDM